MNISRNIATALVLLSVLVHGEAMAQAPRPIAKLIAVQGNVLVSQADAMAAAVVGQPLAAGARVITTAGASATVVYDKGCEIKLGENRRYNVREQAECTAAHAPPLGAATGFAVLGGARVPNTGESLVRGELGVSPGTGVTGFPPGRITGGSIHPADDLAAQAQKDALIAYDDLVKQACNVRLTGQDLGGQTLSSGVYCFPSSAGRLNGELVLDGQGDVESVFVFQVGTALTVADKATVRLINGASSCNVYWQVADSVQLGKEAKFTGTVLTVQNVTTNAGANVTGRLLARSGAVTMDTSSVDTLPCVPPVAPVMGTGGVLGIAAGAIAVGAGIYEATQPKSPN